MKTNFLTYHVYIFIQFVIKFVKFIFPEKATKITVKSYQVIYFVKFMAAFSENLNFNYSVLWTKSDKRPRIETILEISSNVSGFLRKHEL